MKRRTILLILFLVAACSFIAGYWTNRSNDAHKPAVRKVLYYVDPMNPALKSDKPGIAPCGMALEPVYADQGVAAAGASGLQASLPHGTIRISPERQQLIGVKLATVEKVPWSHTLRILGRVTPDETLVYRLNAALSGWIQEVTPVTTGSLVGKNELLATFYSLQYRTTLATYVNLMRSAQSGNLGDKAPESTVLLSSAQLKKLRESGRELPQGVSISQAEYYRKNLLDYGISDYQIQEMVRTGVYTENIDIRAPIAGFILYRNVSPGLRFDRGTEFFRIADLSRVWILADIFENEASYFKPGLRVKIELPYQKKTLYARVSPVLPQFDSATRTFKVRLVAENPGFALRPDMFVNVEFPLSGPPAIIVPVDAVLDSGLQKIVFVDRGNGFFEPRQVETGHFLGERLEIVRGLMPGEKIVVSGNFLIDSEARMQLASSPIAGKNTNDPVCHMNIDEDRSRAEGNLREYRGKTYYFCSPQCRDEFGKEPERYLKTTVLTPEDMAAKDKQAKNAQSGSKVREVVHDHKVMHGSHNAPAAPLTNNGGAPAAKTHTSMPEMPPASPQNESGTQMTAPHLPEARVMGHPQPQLPPGMELPTAKNTAVPGMPPASGTARIDGSSPIPAGKPSAQGTPLAPQTRDQGAMIMPDAQSAPPPSPRSLRGGRLTREEIRALRTQPGMQAKEAPPLGSTQPSGIMPMPGSGKLQAPGPQGAAPMPGSLPAPASGAAAAASQGPGGSMPQTMSPPPRPMSMPQAAPGSPEVKQ